MKWLIRSCATIAVICVAAGTLLATTAGESLRGDPIQVETNTRMSPAPAEQAAAPEDDAAVCKLIRIWVWPGGQCYTWQCCHEFCESDPECS